MYKVKKQRVIVILFIASCFSRHATGYVATLNLRPDGGPADSYFQELGKKIQEEAGIPSEQQVSIRRMHPFYVFENNKTAEADLQYIYVNENLRTMSRALQYFVLRHEATHIKYGDPKTLQEILTKHHPHEKFYLGYIVGWQALLGLSLILAITYEAIHGERASTPPWIETVLAVGFFTSLAALVKVVLNGPKFALQQKQLGEEYRIKAETRADQEAYNSIDCADCLMNIASFVDQTEEPNPKGYFTRKQVEALAQQKKEQLLHIPCEQHR